jgi:hypothetical protein
VAYTLIYAVFIQLFLRFSARFHKHRFASNKFWWERERVLVYRHHFCCFPFVFLFSSSTTNIDSPLNKCVVVCSIQRIFNMCCGRSIPPYFLSVAFPYLFPCCTLSFNGFLFIIRRPACTGSLLPLYRGGDFTSVFPTFRFIFFPQKISSNQW